MITKEHISNAINMAMAGVSNLTETELAVGGFSTPTIRRLFNNLCNINGATYLEVGLWMGGTFVSSFHRNTMSIGIENYAQDFGVVGVKEILEKNIEDHRHKSKDIELYFEDCFTIDISKLPDGIDIFCYDGFHGREAQAKALPYYIDKMADTFLYIVDDWSWKDVFDGTNEGFAALGDKIEILMHWPLRGYTLENDPIWHNSVALFLIKKK